MSKDDETYSSAWNFGPNPDDLYSVKKIIERLIKQMGRGTYKYLNKPVIKFHETKHLSLDISKAKKYLEWRPCLTIDETIKYICDWYMEDKVTYDFDANQIKNYFEKINSNINKI